MVEEMVAREGQIGHQSPLDQGGQGHGHGERSGSTVSAPPQLPPSASSVPPPPPPAVSEKPSGGMYGGNMFGHGGGGGGKKKGSKQKFAERQVSQIILYMMTS